jgi:hypothetical protein
MTLLHMLPEQPNLFARWEPALGQVPQGRAQYSMHIVCFYDLMQGKRHGLKIGFVWVCGATVPGGVRPAVRLIDFIGRLTVNDFLKLLASGAHAPAHPPELTCGSVLSLGTVNHLGRQTFSSAVPQLPQESTYVWQVHVCTHDQRQSVTSPASLPPSAILQSTFQTLPPFGPNAHQGNQGWLTDPPALKKPRHLVGFFGSATLAYQDGLMYTMPAFPPQLRGW